MSLLLMGAGKGVDAVDSAHSIISIKDNGGGLLLVTTPDRGGTDPISQVTITGNSVSAYNTTHDIVEVLTDTTFVLNSAYTDDGTGGTWAEA